MADIISVLNDIIKQWGILGLILVDIGLIASLLFLRFNHLEHAESNYRGIKDNMVTKSDFDLFKQSVGNCQESHKEFKTNMICKMTELQDYKEEFGNQFSAINMRIDGLEDDIKEIKTDIRDLRK